MNIVCLKKNCDFMRKLFNKYDIVLFAVLIITAAAIYAVYYMTAGNENNGAVCEISVDGKIVQTLDLSAPDYEFNLIQNQNIRFSVKNHAIAFISSDCPDKICVRTGYISRAGQTAACLPNHVIIRITGANKKNNKNADIIAG